LLRVSAIDGKENHSDWYIIPYYVVTAKSETQDTTPPVFNWDSVEEVPRSGETINLGRDITIRAEDEESGVYYIAYLWTEDGQTPNAADYTIVNQPVNGAITIKAPNTPGNWVLRVCAANSSYNSSTGVFYTSKVTYFKYEIKDIEAPTMTLNGEAVVRVPLNGNFVDEGVTVTDNVDEQKIIYSEDVVETSEIGTHTITYTATDSAGNTSTITREVIIEGLKLEDTQIQISNTEVEYDGNEQNISVQLPEEQEHQQLHTMI